MYEKFEWLNSLYTKFTRVKIKIVPDNLFLYILQKYN